MNTATFRTYLEALGIEHTWIAERLGVSVRTIEYWTAVPKPDKPAKCPPFDAEELVLEWADRFNEIVDSTVEHVLDMIEQQGTPPEGVDLARYVNEESFRVGEGPGDLSLSMHNALLRQLVLALQAEGLEVNVSWRRPV